MPKKSLPKTPDSLFDPIESESSHSRTPTPRRQRTPSASPKSRITPRRFALRNQNLPWYQKFLISGVTFYSFLILSFLLFLAISRSFLRLSYCEDNNETDCIKCPDNAQCNGTTFVCKEPSYLIHTKAIDLCVIPGSPEEVASNYTTKIEELISQNLVSNVGDIRNLKEFNHLTKAQIETAIKLSDKFILRSDGSFDVRVDNKNINIMLYFVFGLCLLIFILSTYFRNRN